MSCLDAEPPSMLEQHLVHIHNICVLIAGLVSIHLANVVRDFDHTKVKTLERAKKIQLATQIILLPLFIANLLPGLYAGLSPLDMIPFVSMSRYSLITLMWLGQLWLAISVRYRAFRKLRSCGRCQEERNQK
ncbi:MAG: hypothetical protein QXR42_09460 [Candidatus Bathyarchaeia archaeon]